MRVKVIKSFRSACAAIPSEGTEGILCNDESHKKDAKRHNRVCVLFEESYKPSDGTPVVPESYVPIHLFFEEDSISKVE